MSMPLVDVLYAKLHRITCTQAKLDYVGSVTIDQDWMDAAGLFEGQKVDIVNIDNGERLSTYCLSGKRGSGVLCLNGAAAHKVRTGNCLIIIAYVMLPFEEARYFKPNILLFEQPSEHQYIYRQPEDVIEYIDGQTPKYQRLVKEEHGHMSTQISRPQLWDLAHQMLWDSEEYILGLETFFQTYGIKTILDVSGGTGFPSIPLREKGWNVAYADGDFEFYEYAMKQARGQLPGYCCNWQSLTKVVGADLFDALLCCGNTLPYIDAWSPIHPESIVDGQVAVPADQHLAFVARAVSEFDLTLNPGRVLLFDCSNLVDPKHHVIDKERHHLSGYESAQLHWEFFVDSEHSLRIWDYSLTINNYQHKLKFYSPLVTEAMLEHLLTDAGFVNFHRGEMHGDPVYTPYLAHKPK